MLVPGIKIGPTDWQQRIDQSGARLVEVWYKIDQAASYQPILQDLAKRQLIFGLHFWGAASTGHEANLCLPDHIGSESYTLIQSCIQHAADAGAAYVNIHAGNRAAMLINFSTMTMVPDETFPKLSDAQATANRNQALQQLGTFANQRKVKLLVELIPQNVADGAWNDRNARLHPVSEYPASPAGLLELCQQHLVGFTNDFCHTFAYDQAHFQQITDGFAPYTQVIHANTLTPPYNGTDEHRGILPNDFAQEGVFPTRQQFINLLTQLKHGTTHDIWLIGEPQQNHVENYAALKQLIQQVK